MSLPKVPLPVLVVSPSCRYLGFVCMDGRLEIMDARRHHLRHVKDESAKIQAVRALLASALERTHPAALVIECAPHAPLSPISDTLISTVEAVGKAGGCAVVRMTFHEACWQISADGSAAKVASILAERFPLIERDLGSDAATTLRDKDRRRQLRPILATLAIAYAIVRDSIVREARRSHEGI